MTDQVYDAFVSYSHAADDLLAPRLQAGLQRFAKPWWRRRALRIFRDESSLSASPQLWASIATAMEQSAWFVLLLSPDAASSPWVNREIEWWATNKDPSRIIPVLPEGPELRSRVIDVGTGAEVLDLGRRAVFARGGGFSPGGALEPGRYVTINNINQGAVEIWDIPSGTLVGSVTFAGDTAFSAGVFDPSGRYLPGGSINGRAWVLDLVEVVSGAEIATAVAMDVQAHDGTVASHALSGDGLLATSSFDGSLRLWDVRAADEPILELSVGLDFASFVAFSPDDGWLYYTDTGDTGYVIRRFPLDPDRLVELAEGLVTRGFTGDECRRFPSAPSCEVGGSDG